MPKTLPAPHVIYRLHGRNYEYANWLEELLTDINTEGADIDPLTFLKTAQRIKPDFLETLGLKEPAIQVRQLREGHPRAYEEWPRIFAVGEGDWPHYYMFCPVDYRGEHFVPLSGVVMKPDDMEELYSTTFNAFQDMPLFQGDRFCIPLPDDFDPETASIFEENGPCTDDMTVLAYLKHGKSSILMKEGPDGTKPDLYELGQLHRYLIYQVPRERAREYDNFHPPGFVPINTATFFWIAKNRADKTEDITLSDPALLTPAPVITELNRLLGYIKPKPAERKKKEEPPMTAPSQVIYRLTGKSEETAQWLEKIVEQAAKDYESKWGDKSQPFLDGLLEKLSILAPSVYKAAGLDSPAVQISRIKDGHRRARAYKNWPEIYATPTDPPEYYMMSPVDSVTGDHFRPEDGIDLDLAGIARAVKLLFADGWLGNAPLVPRPPEGTVLPKNFSSKESRVSQNLNPFCDRNKTVRAFLASGRSLHVVKDFLRWEKEYEAMEEKPATKPCLGAYWQLWNPKAPDKLKGKFNAAADYHDYKVPELVTLGQDHFLVYTVPRGRKADDYIHPPPDALPVSTKTFLWFYEDAMDIRTGTLPPEGDAIPRSVQKEALDLASRTSHERQPPEPGEMASPIILEIS